MKPFFPTQGGSGGGGFNLNLGGCGGSLIKSGRLSSLRPDYSRLMVDGLKA
jgi:hypothetical protein